MEQVRWIVDCGNGRLIFEPGGDCKPRCVGLRCVQTSSFVDSECEVWADVPRELAAWYPGAKVQEVRYA